MSLSHARQSQERLFDMLTAAMGPLGAWLAEDTLIELMVNPDGSTWAEFLGTPVQNLQLHCDAHTVEHIIRLVASTMGVECHAGNPTLSAVLPQSGARFQGFLPPIVTAPSLIIRKRALQVFTLQQYVDVGSMTSVQCNTLYNAVQQKQNIIIAGSTGSGKTTALNAVLAEVAKTGERIVTIEDTPELQCTAPNHLALYTREGMCTMQQLVKDTMRCRPDRIIIGEVRGAEALDVVDSWSTGHPGGLCTIHANGCRESLTRMESLIRRANVPTEVARQLLAEVSPMIVYLERTATGRRIKEIAQIQGLEEEEYLLAYL